MPALDPTQCPQMRSWRRGCVRLATLLWLTSMCAAAAEFYVAVNGTRSGKGTLDEPWDLKTASEHPLVLKPGDVIYLRGGNYEVPGKLNLNLRLEGEKDRYITVRPYGNERVIIDGGIHVLGPWVILRDLEIRNTTESRLTELPGPFPSDIPQPAGINVFASNVRVINNVIHDTATGLSSWVSAPDNEFYGNIVYYNGWLGPDRPHGHGVYMQNKDGRKLLQDNVVFGNFEYGMQIYGSSETFLNGFRLEGNAVFNNGSLGGTWSRNLLVGGTVVVQNPSLIDNFTYFPLTQDHGGDNNLGFFPNGSGCSGLEMRGNTFASGGVALTMHACMGSAISSNKIFGPTRGFNAAPFAESNTVTASRPAGMSVHVRPNTYERGRAHIIVFNWDRSESADADLSALGFTKDDTIEVRDVQNLDGAPVFRGVYDGKSIRLPLALTEISKPIGTIKHPPVHSDPEFNVFLVRVVETRPREETAVTIMQEAENGALYRVGVQQNSEASGGASVSFTEDGSNWAAYLFEIPVERDYVVWIRGRQRSGNQTPLSIAVDGGEFVSVVLPAASAPRWTWSGVSLPASRHPLRLGAGSHWLVFSSADATFELDSLLVTSDPAFIPAG